MASVPPVTTPTAPSSANDRQHGGSHYAAPFQHWDFVAALNLGYFEAQITRYTCRHRKKAGLLDVEKSGHFWEKLGELTERGYRNQTDFRAAMAPRGCQNAQDVFDLFIRSQRPLLTQSEKHLMLLAAFWQTQSHIKTALEIVQELKAEYAAADANRAYNAQSLDPPKATVTPEQVRAADDMAEFSAHKGQSNA